MTQQQWRQFEQAIAEMTDDEKSRLLEMVRCALSQSPSASDDPVLGMMADEPQLVDQIIESTYASREKDPLRHSLDE
jgi:hypothetical protein